MYRTMLDSTRYEGPLVRLIPGATRDVQNWRMDRRALCVEHILRAGARRTKLRHCFVPSIIHLPRLGGLHRGWHNWKKARRNSGNQGAFYPPREVEKKRQIDGVLRSTSFKDRVAPRTSPSHFIRSSHSNGSIFSKHIFWWCFNQFEICICLCNFNIDLLYNKKI